MSNISNVFYVTALEDGTTLHGNLAADKSLSQAWNGTTAVPNWEVAANQPTIYLTLQSGSSLVQPANDYQWYYNESQQPISFNQSTGISSDGLFLKTTKSVTLGGETKVMPALKIVGNLAGTANVDIDTITFKGNYVVSNSSIPFSCVAQIKISAMTASGYVGGINFVGGVSDITETGQTLTMYGILYSGETGEPVTGISTHWFLNDETGSGTTGTSITVGGTTYTNAYQVTEGDIVDHAFVRCEFSDASDNILAAAYAGIDDMQDPQQMYIMYNGNVGNPASLRKGDTAPFTVFVGSRDSATVLSGWESAVYKVQLLDSESHVIKAPGLSYIPNPDEGDPNYYRTLDKYPSDYQDESLQNKAYFSVSYSVPEAYGKKITGIVIAYTS